MCAYSEESSAIVHFESDSASSTVKKTGDQIEHGITPRAFAFACCNALISQAISTPYIFTTAGWVCFIAQAVTSGLTLVSSELLRIVLQNEQVRSYGDAKDIPSFEREYTFLAEYCGGRVCRNFILVVILLQYLASIATIVGAIGVCGTLIAPAMSANIWIIIFSLLLILAIAIPWLKQVTIVMGALGVFGTIGTLGSWVGTSFAILPDSHLVENIPPREPVAAHIIAAISLSVWSCGDLPSLTPYIGCVKGTTNRRISLILATCQVISLFYIYIMGVAGMQICDGLCSDFYPASLTSGIGPNRVRLCLAYSLYIFILIRMFSMAQVKMVAVMVATEKAISQILVLSLSKEVLAASNAWRLALRVILVAIVAVAAALVKHELAYFQAVTSSLLTTCLLYLCPIWFYYRVTGPHGTKLYMIYVSIALTSTFMIVATYVSVMGILD
ncbi:hypothetical protein FOL47_003085 [Perkinsus chesapeaki]|uniref:Solute carrier 38 member n=1 Tax=Perkinsus chesapeaki TaxID=330153 RepID=A0A7J6MAU9_PERCH|nr:hypothetical protein FOL47_003085 [Perkinsus chesapeaki]